MMTKICPCNHCPYNYDDDCDDEEKCLRYLQWSQKNYDRQMFALARKYNTALKRIETQNSKLKELKKQCTKAKGIIKELLDFDFLPDVKIKKRAEQFLKDCDIDNAIQQANKGLDFDKIAGEMEQDLKDSEMEK